MARAITIQKENGIFESFSLRQIVYFLLPKLYQANVAFGSQKSIRLLLEIVSHQHAFTMQQLDRNAPSRHTMDFSIIHLLNLRDFTMHVFSGVFGSDDVVYEPT